MKVNMYVAERQHSPTVGMLADLIRRAYAANARVQHLRPVVGSSGQADQAGAA